MVIPQPRDAVEEDVLQALAFVDRTSVEDDAQGSGVSGETKGVSEMSGQVRVMEGGGVGV